MSCKKKCCDPLSNNYTILALILIVLQFSKPRALPLDGAENVAGCGGGLLPIAGLDNSLLFLIVFILLTKCGCNSCDSK